ncbi:MAG: hypothetical protein K6T78_06940 [Alicyclobacillus sp.]|nr:hypothetical protein [Alicyclobacillus sp.]
MYTQSNLLVCDTDGTYTCLNRYDPRTHLFEGEYSLVHNAYAHDAYFLSRFLMDHRGHQLMLIDSDDARYSEVRHTYQHYMEDDVPRYVDELMQRQLEAEWDHHRQQDMGQLQLLIVKKLIEQEWEAVQAKESKSERETYVLLGQDFAFRRSVQTINRVVEFPHG